MIGLTRGDARKKRHVAPPPDTEAMKRARALALDVQQRTRKATLLAWTSIALALFAMAVTLTVEVVL